MPLSFAAFLLGRFFVVAVVLFFVACVRVSLSFVPSHKGSSRSGEAGASRSGVSGSGPRSLSAAAGPGGGLCPQPRSRARDPLEGGVLRQKERTVYLFLLIYVYTGFLRHRC